VTPRRTPRPVHEGPRYWSVELESGVHRFRFPSFAAALNLVEEWNKLHAACPEHVVLEDTGWLYHMSPLMAAYAGLCWFHEDVDLSTPAPDARDPSALYGYGAAIVEEFQDRGYTLMEIRQLHAACQEAIWAKLGIVSKAEAKAAFTDGGEESTAPPPASPTPPEQGASTTSQPSAA